MLFVDEFKKNEPQLRLVALMLAVGLVILLAGLWWVQVVSANEFQSHLETQSYRTIRLPAARGKILDCAGRVLAENRPVYNLSIYLDDLSGQFNSEYDRLRPVKITPAPPPFWAFWRPAGTVQTNRVRLNMSQVEALSMQARYNVVNRIVGQAGQKIGQPLALDPKKFNQHYQTSRALPFPILESLDARQIAQFEENFSGDLAVDLELESVRDYPHTNLAAHVLGYLRRDNDSQAGEDPVFKYRLKDYLGVIGLEAGYDPQLRGRAGGESVLVNSLGYRQAKTVWSPPEPGQNLVLTLDLDLQQAATAALVRHQGTNARAAVVVMDVRNGDVLALVSSPAFDPGDFARGISFAKYQQLQALQAEKNRATAENYAPGSIFKVIVSLAALEAGLNPDQEYTVEANPEDPLHGCYFLSARSWVKDTAPPGKYKFKRAIERSSNSYFIQAGLQAGVERVVALAKKFQLGETIGLPTRQETGGDLPTVERVRSPDWRTGDTANVCIGQGAVAVTPLQMAVVYSAIANGGTVFWPRLVARLEPQDPTQRQAVNEFPTGLVRSKIGVSGRSLRILHEAMLGETEDLIEGTGTSARVPGLLICGKTGTAQVPESRLRAKGWNYWFASFAPYESPRYAVVVMVESEARGSGGGTCAPIAHDIYETILNKEKSRAGKILAAN